MKIWLDVLTGKQLLFAEPIIRRLEAKHSILCTRRNYRELNWLAKMRKINTRTVGRHGGREKLSKLTCSARRVERLAGLIYGFRPDLAISFQSPEAARVAFGLGVRHIGFADTAHADAVMRLTIPYLDKLLIPWILPKSDFAKYGIAEKDILKYRAIDAAVTSRRSFEKRVKLERGPKTVVIRMAEEHASYNEFSNQDTAPIIAQILKCLPGFRVIVLARYADQVKFLRRRFGRKIKVMQGALDGMDILRHADVFVGSGGTMTAEAALLGIPTISYVVRRDYKVDAFLERRKLVTRESDPAKIPHIISRMAESSSARKRRAQRLLDTMEDPFAVLRKAMNLQGLTRAK